MKKIVNVLVVLLVISVIGMLYVTITIKNKLDNYIELNNKNFNSIGGLLNEHDGKINEINEGNAKLFGVILDDLDRIEGRPNMNYSRK